MVGVALIVRICVLCDRGACMDGAVWLDPARVEDQLAGIELLADAIADGHCELVDRLVSSDEMTNRVTLLACAISKYGFRTLS